MLAVTQLAGSGAGWALLGRQMNMFNVLQRLGLADGLRLALDAGDAASLPASSTKWLDLSGNGYDFFRGTSTSAESSDPTINGTAGGLSANEYLSFDGGDYLTYDTTNETWMNNLHKASGKWTLAAWLRFGGTNGGLFGTNRDSSSVVGISGGITVGGKLYVAVNNGSGTQVFQRVSSAALTTGANIFVAISVDITAPSVSFALNNFVVEDYSQTLGATPSSSNAGNTLQIGARGNNTVPLPNTSRLFSLNWWEGTTLTTSQLQVLYTATRGRFGV